MTSFFYVVSIAFHTSVPALRKCMDTSRKKVFWLRVQPLVHHLLHLFVGPERLASHRLFLSGPKMWKSLRVRSGKHSGCGRHSKNRSWIVATVERAVWDQALSCCNKTPVLISPCHLDLIAGCRWFVRRSAYVALVTVFPLGMKCPKITPRSSKRESVLTFPADGCVRNFFGFGEKVWRHSLLVFLVSGWW